MNPIAVYFDTTVLYWSAIIITVGLLAALMMSLSLQVTNKGRIVSMMLFFPLALLFSVPLCRMLHWYCHQEQYDGFFKAMTDYSAGSYVLPAAIPGVWLAAWIAAKLDDGDTAKLLDAAAPGMALVIAFVRLSALFSSACRSKISVTTGVLQHLPIAAGITNSAGVTEYRFATFFIHFLLMLLFCLRLELPAAKRLCEHRADRHRRVHPAAAHPLQPPVHPGKRDAHLALAAVDFVAYRPRLRRLYGVSGAAPRRLVSPLLRRDGPVLHHPHRGCVPPLRDRQRTHRGRGRGRERQRIRRERRINI